MHRLIEAIEESYRDYNLMRDETYKEENLRRMRASFVVMCYAIAAPIIFLLTISEADHSMLITEFVLMFIMALLVFLVTVYIRKSRIINSPEHKLFRNIAMESSAVLCEMTMLSISIVASKRTAMEGGRPDFLTFVIASIALAVLVCANPYIYMAAYIILSVFMLSTIISFFEGGVSGKVIFNLIIVCIFIVVVYFLRFTDARKEKNKQRIIEQSRRSQEQFITSLTHELRTPLNAILGKNQVIGRDTQDEDIRNLSDEIRNSGKVMLSLINDILDLSKLRNGKMTIVPVNYSVSETVEEMAGIMRSEAQAHSLKFEVQFAEDLPSVVNGDAVRIKQIMMNLLSNSIKYTKEGTITFAVSFEKKDDETGILHFAVKDTGVGIKADDLPKLTEAFVRVNEKNNFSIEGTGLGLAITSNLLKLMGSALKIDSIYGLGSTFSFDLEQKIIDSRPYTEKQQEEHEAKLHKKSFVAPDARMLIVDDNIVNYTVCRGLLKYYEVQTEYAASGVACLGKLAAGDYDLVLLDHMMPEMDGVETLRRIRGDYYEKCKDMPVVAMTANSYSNAYEYYGGLGFASYLSKPLSLEALENVLLTYLPKDKIIEK